ncbi:MAG: EamA family transporter [Candidatus Eremiobacteraeota bacterium]|nr:EamA family transporter [Candidatus Eremiobacteraeota bacterium]
MMVWVAYAAMCLIWGTTWLVIKVGLHYLPPVTGSGLRFLIAGLVLFAVAAARRELLAPREVPWKLVGVMGVFMCGVNYALVYLAETRLDSGLVAVLFATFPFFMFAFGRVLRIEKTTPLVWAGATVAFAGVAVISVGGQFRASSLYALAVIAAAASAAFANCYAKKHAQYGPLATLPLAMTAAGGATSAWGIGTEHVDWALAVAPVSLAALAYLALLGSGLAFFLNLWALQRLPASVIALVPLIIPVIAVSVGIVAGERFGAREALGSAVVVVGISIALARRLRRREPFQHTVIAPRAAGA